MSREPQFEIGATFIRRGRKNKQVETVVDIITWTNSNGECVGHRYVCEHDFMGQVVTDSDVVGATIALGIAEDVCK